MVDAASSLNRNTLGDPEDIEVKTFVSGVIDYSGCGLPIEQYRLLDEDYMMAQAGSFFSPVTFEEVDIARDGYVNQIFEWVERLPSYIRTYEIAYFLYGDL
jgi:hypothetical protein